MAQADTAQFVITGIFDPKKLMESLEAALGALEKKLGGRMATMTKNVNDAYAAALKTAGGDAGRAAGNKLKEANKPALSLLNSMKGTDKHLGVVVGNLGTAVRRVVLWAAASRLIFGLMQKTTQAFKDYIELNKALVNIQKIRPAGFDTSPISASILSNAEKYGLTFSDIAETQRTFFQQGFSTAQVLKLTEAQLLGVTAAGLSANESIELLIGSMSIFHVEASKAVIFIDKLQAVQANYAVSTQDLATALRRVGPVVEQFGGDIDHVIGVITALKEATRKSGEFIGTALTTIFSRMYVGKGVSQLQAMGIQVKKTAYQFKPLKQVLGEISARWGEMGDVERSSLAFALGGRRRFSQVIALLDNYSTALEASATSSSSFGAALVAQKVEVTSISRQFEILKSKVANAGIAIANAFTGSSGVDGGAYITLAKQLQHLADTAKKSAKKIVTYTKAISGLLAAIIAWKSITSLGLLILAVVKGLSGLRVAFLGVGAAIKVFTLGTVSAETAIVGLSTALTAVMPYVAAIAVVVAGGVLAWKHYRKETNKNAEEVQKLGDAYTNLDKAAKNSKTTLRDYYAVVKQFQTFKGPEAIKRLSGNLNNIASVKRPPNTLIGSLQEIGGLDLSGLEPGDAYKQWEKLAGTFKNSTDKANELKKTIDDLKNVMGFLSATNFGSAKQIEAFKQEILNTETNVLSLSNSLRLLAIPGTDLTQEDAFKQITGISPEEFKKIGEQFGGNFFGIKGYVDTKSFDFEAIKKAGISTVKNTKSLMGKLLNSDNAEVRAGAEKWANDYFNTITKVSAVRSNTFIDKLRRFLSTGNPTAVKKEVFIPDVQIDENVTPAQVNALRAGLNDMLSQVTSEAALNRGLDKATSSKINIYDMLLNTDGGDKASKELASIIGVTSDTLKNAIAKHKSALTNILDLYIAAATSLEETGNGISIFPKGPTKEYTTVINSVSFATVKYTDALKKASQESLIFGKSLPKAQLTALKSLISSGLSSTNAVKSMKAEQDAVMSVIGVYEKRRNKIKNDSKLGNESIDLAAKILKLRTRYEELGADMDVARVLAEEQLVLTKKQIQEYLTLSESIRQVTVGEKARLAGIKTTSVINKNAIKSAEKYRIKLVAIAAANSKLIAGRSYGAAFQSGLSKITNQYDLQLATLRATRKEIVAGAVAKASTYGVTTKETAVLGSNLAIANEITDTFSNLDTITKNKLSALQSSTAEQLKQVDAQTEALKLETARKINLYSLNEALNYNKSVQEEINSLAEGYGASVADILTNINKIMYSNGGFKIALEPIADAYMTNLKKQLSTALSGVFQQLAKDTATKKYVDLKAQLEQAQTEAPYQIGGGILYQYLISGFKAGSEGVYTAITQAFNSSQGQAYDSTTFGPIAPSTGLVLPSSLSDGGVTTALGRLNTTTGASAAAAMATAVSTANTLKTSVQSAKKDAVRNTLLQSMGALLGRMAGSAAGGGGAGAQSGSALGSSLGNMLGLYLKTSPLGLAALGIGGGILGGIWGGHNDNATSEPIDPTIYQSNTDALRENTQALITNSQSFAFMSKLINAPTDFSIPAPALLGGNMPIIVVNSGGGDPEEAAYDGLSKAYSGEYRRIGRRG